MEFNFFEIALYHFLMKVLVQGNKIVELAKSDYQSLTHEQLTTNRPRIFIISCELNAFFDTLPNYSTTYYRVKRKKMSYALSFPRCVLHGQVLVFARNHPAQPDRC